MRLAVLAAGAVALAWQPPADWIERAYANGVYPRWEHLAFTLAAHLPWSLGDAAALPGLAGLIWCVAALVRAPRRTLGRYAGAALSIAALAALYVVWFEVSWGWNYARAPLATRVRYDPARVTARRADALRARAMREMNALAPQAHARAGAPLDLRALRAAWFPAVQRVGDDWTPLVGAAKPTVANPFMVATGTSGFINPFALTVQLASDVLWFERPFALAHEWSHLAAYAREDEANYLAIVSCIRSPDPVIRYSGWFEMFLYLPPKAHYARRDFSPLVWADFAAMRRRDARHINVLLAHWSWQTYNAYLKTNRIASGIENYNEVSRLLLAIPLDRRGLPLRRRVTHP